MRKELLFNKLSDLKEKFKSFFQHRKKVAALENFSVDSSFQHKNYLPLVKACMNEGFLGETESGFLDYMLNRYEINYLDWAHKTKWLKRQMHEKAMKAMPPIQAQVFFDFDKKRTPVHIPVELLATAKMPMGKRI